MHRPNKVGERTLLTGTSQTKQTMVVKIDGQVAKDERVAIDVEFEVEREILAVTENGKPTHARVKLLKISGSFNDAPVTQLKSGDVIDSKVEAGSAILVNGEKATVEQAKLAQALPRASGRSSVTDDEAYGPGRKIKVGDVWPINAEVATKQAAEAGFAGMKPEDMKGSVKLLELTNHEGQPCLKVRGDIEISGAGIPLPNAPASVKVTELSGKMSLETSFPVDPNATEPQSERAMTMRTIAVGDVEKDGRKARIEINAEVSNRGNSRAKRIE